MGYNFPASPSVGQAFNNWVWDGEKWQSQGSAAQGAVRYDIAQGLTSTQQVQGRSNIYAAPFDALAYNGMQINGSFDISQELGLVGRTTNGYICDGWDLYIAGGGPAVTGFIAASTIGYNVLLISVQTAKASLVAGDLVFTQQKIEGYRVGRLSFGTASTQPITIGFQSGHHRPGVYCVAVRNGASNRSYVATYTHAVADVYQYNTITIPGDTTGTWAYDNSAGLVVSFAMAAGSTYQAPSANTWTTGNYISVASAVNGVAATSDFFRITQVVVLPGIEAPSAARSPLIMRPYDQELVTCQRYWQKKTGILYSGWAGASSNVTNIIALSASMRVPPTVSFSSVVYTNSSALNAWYMTTEALGFALTVTADGRVATTFDYALDARL